MMGAAAFWIGLALCLIAAMYFRSRSETVKHETLRQIVEKTGQVNEAQFKSLFEPAPNAFTRVPAPGGGYRTLRVLGLLLMFIAVGVVFLFLVIGWSGTQPWNRAAIGCAAATIPALLGIGLFVSSRFLPRPLTDSKDLQAIR
jgi:hypothetical protein